MSVSGKMKTMDLAELLQWVTMGRKTGALAFIREKIKNYIYFKQGQIISSRSNEPNKQLGHYLLYQGRITEVQLMRALQLHQHSRVVLGKVLVGEGFLTQEEVAAALVSRTEEVIYDLFLWEDGYFHFTEDGYDTEELILIHVDLNSVIFEGVRRKDEWARIRGVFPSNNVVLGISPEADLKSTELKPIHKKLLFLANKEKTISEMILELHGSDFQVSFELFELYQKEILHVKEVRTAPVSEEQTVDPFDQGLELMKAQKFTEALVLFQEIVNSEPQNEKVHEQIDRAERAICEDWYRTSLQAHKVPYFQVPETDLLKFNLSSQEGFIASRINGSMDVKSIVTVSPMREFEILQSLDRLLNMELIRMM